MQLDTPETLLHQPVEAPGGVLEAGYIAAKKLSSGVREAMAHSLMASTCPGRVATGMTALRPIPAARATDRSPVAVPSWLGTTSHFSVSVRMARAASPSGKQWV
jgi:hypothetical protein